MNDPDRIELYQSQMAVADEKRLRAEDEAHQLQQKLIQVEKEHEKTLALLQQERNFGKKRADEAQAKEQVRQTAYFDGRHSFLFMQS
jgi:hypothetical protein